MYCCRRSPIKESLPQYDTVVRANQRFDLRGPILRTLIVACIEQGGRLLDGLESTIGLRVGVLVAAAFRQAVREVLGG